MSDENKPPAAILSYNISRLPDARFVMEITVNRAGAQQLIDQLQRTLASDSETVVSSPNLITIVRPALPTASAAPPITGTFN